MDDAMNASGTDTGWLIPTAHHRPRHALRMPAHAAHRKLLAFVAVSIVLHALALSAWHAPPRGAAHAGVLPTLAVTIARDRDHGRADAPPRALVKPMPPQPPAPTTVREPYRHPAPRAVALHAKRPRPEQLARAAASLHHRQPTEHAKSNRDRATKPIAPASNLGQPSAAEHGWAESAMRGRARAEPAVAAPDAQAVASLLRRALLREFRYPASALENGWEGQVTLHLLLAADGRVSESHVVRGSGYRILDRAAEHAASRIGRVPGAAKLLAGQSLAFQVPVDYRLPDE